MSLQDELDKLQIDNPIERIISDLQSHMRTRLDQTVTQTYNQICEKLAKKQVFQYDDNYNYILFPSRIQFCSDKYLKEKYNGFDIREKPEIIKSIPNIEFDYDNDYFVFYLTKTNKTPIIYHYSRTFDAGSELTDLGKLFWQQLSDLCSKDGISISAKERYTISKGSGERRREKVKIVPLGKNHHEMINDRFVSGTTIIQYEIKQGPEHKGLLYQQRDNVHSFLNQRINGKKADTPNNADIPEADQTKSTSSKETLDLIKQLAALHEQGILTDEEFADKKAELLSKL